MNSRVLLGIIVAAVGLAGAFALAYSDSPAEPRTPSMVDGATLHDLVTFTVVRDGQTVYEHTTHNLVTDAGKSFIRDQAFGTGGTSTARYIGLSTDGASPAAADIALAGEITGQGLLRAQGTVTNGSTGVATISATFTMQSGGPASFTVSKAGLFNALASGTLVAETVVSNPPTLYPGDSITISWQVTIS